MDGKFSVCVFTAMPAVAYRDPETAYFIRTANGYQLLMVANTFGKEIVSMDLTAQELVSNKVSTLSAPNTTTYPCSKAVTDWLAGNAFLNTLRGYGNKYSDGKLNSISLSTTNYHIITTNLPVSSLTDFMPILLKVTGGGWYASKNVYDFTINAMWQDTQFNYCGAIGSLSADGANINIWVFKDGNGFVNFAFNVSSGVTQLQWFNYEFFYGGTDANGNAYKITNITNATLPTGYTLLTSIPFYQTATQGWVTAQNFLKTETEPAFTASAAHGIASSDVTNWNGKLTKPAGSTNQYIDGTGALQTFPTIPPATIIKYLSLNGTGDGTTVQFSVAHALGTNKVNAVITPIDGGAANQLLLGYYVTVDATNVYLNFLSAPASGATFKFMVMGTIMS